MTDTPIPQNSPEFEERLATQFVPSTNINGWTGARQKRFLESIAEGETIVEACRHVFLSPQSAYAFRRGAKGRAFDLGWKAADLLARERVAARLFLRATEGQEVTTSREDGPTITKHYHDNRLALTMLARLDRYADASENTAPGNDARMVAADFDAYLDLVGTEGGPARAGLFMLARHPEGNRPVAELAPVLALARADRHLRCGTLAPDIDVADLDPARRADWTADQWRRAEAAGVVELAPEPLPEPEVMPEPAPAKPASDCKPLSTPDDDDPFWFDEYKQAWRTTFVPPEDFEGTEVGEWFDPAYERDLSEEELAILGLIAPGSDDDLAIRTAERDAWFAARARLACVKPAPVGEPTPLEQPAALPAEARERPTEPASPEPGDPDGERPDRERDTPRRPAVGPRRLPRCLPSS